jgi:transposase
MNGARVGDLFMSLIHTCDLNGVNAFDYLVELLRHPKELAASPSEWMQWNYRATLARSR